MCLLVFVLFPTFNVSVTSISNRISKNYNVCWARKDRKNGSKAIKLQCLETYRNRIIKVIEPKVSDTLLGMKLSSENYYTQIWIALVLEFKNRKVNPMKPRFLFYTNKIYVYYSASIANEIPRKKVNLTTFSIFYVK